MYQPGYTITPHVEYTEDGQEVVTDFDIGTPYGYNSRYDNDYFQDNYGNIHHRFEEAEIREDGEWDEDAHNYQTVGLLMDTVGGQDAYNQLTAWCYQNLPEDEIAAFNDLVDTGDYGLIEEAIQRLYQHYQEVASQYNYSRNEWDDSQVEYEEDDQDSDVDYSQIQQTVFEAVGGQDVYNAMLTWGEQYLSEDVIDAYDAAIESGDYDQISDAVGWLYEQFIENT